MDMDISENLILKDYDTPSFSRNCLINDDRVRKNAEKTITAYSIKTPGIKTVVKLLSGGNQQKVILAREFSADPSVVLACQPTRGLDIGASEFVRQHLIEKRNRMCSILLISADLEEIISICDRIAVMFEGKIVGIVDNGEDLDLNTIGLMMAGHYKEIVSA
jgi:simple sugar transport system ATP-binding protein